MKSKKLFKFISLVVALCMVFSLTAFAVPKNHSEDNDNDEDGDAKEFVIKNGVIKGYGNDEFGWDDYVKRGDLTLMIVRAFHLNMMNKGNFEDVKDLDYYSDAIATLKAHGIAKGDGKNFNPKKYVTIGEAILIIERSVKVANNNVVVNREVDLAQLYDEVNLDQLYDKEIDKKASTDNATRGDIALLLYLVFSKDVVVDDDDDEIVEFTVDKDEDYVTFGENSIDDFEDVFGIVIEDEDKELDYIKITLPSSVQGKLYYDYEDNKLVTSSTKLFLDDEEDEILLEDVTFVPNENYSGTFYLKYDAYDQADDEDESDVRLYKGLIKITVLRDEETDENVLDTITYKINDNDYEVAEFDKADFNDNLDSVTFEIPLSSEGKLYFKYDTEKDLVSSSDEFDYTELSDITFVPNKDFVGTTYIDYTAEDGDKDYTGKIKIVVKDTYDIELMTIEAAKGSTITFDGDDFDDAFEDSTDYSSFDNVMFELVDDDYGTLKYADSPIEADDNFTQSQLDGVKLYLDDTNEDTFLINYTVHEDGKEFDGVIKVIIE